MSEQRVHTPLATVVVPTKNSAPFIGACLASLRAQTVPLELIVVDNHSTDATVEIARPLADRVEILGPERSRQRNAGLELATGAVVAFIDSDMELQPEVMAEAIELLARPATQSVIIPERAFGAGFLPRCRDLEKRLYLGNPDVEAARVFRTAEVRRVGGYREDLRAGEDWDLADRIAALEPAGERSGQRTTARTSSIIWHNEGRIDLRTTFAKKRYYGRSFATYLSTRTTEGRRMTRPAVFGQSILWAEPRVTAGLALLKSVEIAGLSLGIVEGRRRS